MTQINLFFNFFINFYNFKTADVGSTPIVGVIKENEFFEHDPNVQPLEAFVQNERFLTFGEVTSKSAD